MSYLGGGLSQWEEAEQKDSPSRAHERMDLEPWVMV